ncbi:outer membrane lipoprotein carrier protein LolA [Ferrovibrio sp.]|uniref:LolA family protein n=1 Tax=Ferrovibrio sp. TaxID=1917215 RepID=UPI001B570874|nr:outer membrane lipoprotein carrier protein LolA [Ferrovibrio sp.]MBP7063460.1 outer membrane lipoprotein carrier protein LolA [Ferrovibrio sp.]
MTQNTPSRRSLLATGLAGLLFTFAWPAQAKLSPAERAELDRLASYFNSIRSLMGRFLQIGPDGSAAEGLIALQRPGRFRFEYDPPAPLLIVSDGSYITMEDRQLKSVDRLPLGSTPLDILVRDQVSFDDPKLAVQRLERGASVLRVTLADAGKPHDGSLVLSFSDRPLGFTGWTVHDAQGQTTTVALSALDLNPTLPDSLFRYGMRPAQLRELQRRR